MDKQLLALALAPAFIAQAATAQAIPPYGWLRHCGLTQDPACNIGRSLTGEDLAWTHAGVAGQISPAEDPADVWQLFPAEGDCEDYALSMRAALTAFGLDPADASIVIGWAQLPDGAGSHAVLEVNLRGDIWILDSAADHIYSPGARPYPFEEQARHVHGRVEWQTPEEEK